jgi:hypothetical protein
MNAREKKTGWEPQMALWESQMRPNLPSWDNLREMPKPDAIAPSVRHGAPPTAVITIASHQLEELSEYEVFAFNRMGFRFSGDRHTALFLFDGSTDGAAAIGAILALL